MDKKIEAKSRNFLSRQSVYSDKQALSKYGSTLVSRASPSFFPVRQSNLTNYPIDRPIHRIQPVLSCTTCLFVLRKSSPAERNVSIELLADNNQSPTAEGSLSISGCTHRRSSANRITLWVFSYSLPYQVGHGRNPNYRIWTAEAMGEETDVP